MIDLTGPPRPWPTRLTQRFAGEQERSWDRPGGWASPAPRGEPALLDRLGELFGCPVERTVVVGGVRQFAAAWAGRTAQAVVETPTYLDVPEILGRAGGVRRVPWNALVAAASAIPAPATVWVTSPLRNPDGISVGRDLAAALDRLASLGHTVIINQVYRWFADETAREVHASSWTVTSMAKLAGGGSRLGWVVTPVADDATLGLTVLGPPTAWQRTWGAFLDARTLAGLVASCVEPTQDARRAFAERAREVLGWTVPEHGLSLVVECAGTDEETAVEMLAHQGLRVSPGRAFDCPVPSVRLAFSGTSVHEARRAAELIAALREREGVAGYAPWAVREPADAAA